MLASCLLLHCLQIKLIEDDLKQLTKLEIKRRNLDTENLQVGAPTFFAFFATLYLFFIFVIVGITLSRLHDHIFKMIYTSSNHNTMYMVIPLSSGCI